MKIDVYSNMHNEEQILPYWLRHYDMVADRIFIWDDESNDRTVEILSQNPKVTFLDMGQHGDDDAYWVTGMFPQYEQHSIGFADWVIVADADEFIYHPRLIDVLEEEKGKGTQVIQCSGYAMVADSFPTSDGQIWEEIKLGLPDSLMSKWTIHAAIPGIRFGKGRHGPVHNQRAFIRDRGTGIKLLHYRYMGDEYFQNRDWTVLKRNGEFFHKNYTYSPKRKVTLPDRTRGAALYWYQDHAKEATNVVD